MFQENLIPPTNYSHEENSVPPPSYSYDLDAEATAAPKEAAPSSDPAPEDECHELQDA